MTEKRPRRRKAFWTVWGEYHLCSKHEAVLPAFKAAAECEKRGGAPHEFYEVYEVFPKKVKRGK
jgi:hypothetical protein